MAFCKNCGTEIGNDVKFCPGCGATTDGVQENVYQQQEQAPVMDAAVNTAPYMASDAQQNKVMAVLAYFGILVLVPIFAAKNSPFARFHANQGLVLLIVEVAWGIIYGVINAILTSLLWSLSWELYGFLTAVISILGFISAAVYIALLVLAIMGIVGAVKEQTKPLPVIGKFTLLK